MTNRYDRDDWSYDRDDRPYDRDERGGYERDDSRDDERARLRSEMNRPGFGRMGDDRDYLGAGDDYREDYGRYGYGDTYGGRLRRASEDRTTTRYDREERAAPRYDREERGTWGAALEERAPRAYDRGRDRWYGGERASGREGPEYGTRRRGAARSYGLYSSGPAGSGFSGTAAGYDPYTSDYGEEARRYRGVGERGYSEGEERGARASLGGERTYREDPRRDDWRGERGWLERASDEVASWFGDDDAARRRRRDERRGMAGRGPKGYRRSDDRVREEINDRLTDDDSVDASEIEVKVDEGVVTLSGTVDDRSEKRRAADIAERVSGVRDVLNEIRLRRAAGTGTAGTA